MTKIIKGDFPFDEIRKESGDFFSNIKEMEDLGFTENQMWSVVCTDFYDGSTYSYGPRDHWINLLGYVATKEEHDGATYYEEFIELDDEDIDPPDWSEGAVDPDSKYSDYRE
jgi:hypothetical protein